MAKAEPLTMEALNTPQITPKAATPTRSPAAAPSAEPKRRPRDEKPKEDKEHLQLLIPKAEARAIRVAAAERGLTNSAFMLSCFHAFMKKGKHDA